jgi:murein tripeptide amidase MpaA
VVLLTGDKPGSEPETQALCQLIHKIHPAWVVSFHDPLACIEDPRHSELGAWLARLSPCRSSPAWAMKRPAHSAAGAPI